MAAQSTFEINIINLSSIALSIANVTPPSAQWSTDGGATAPNEGDVISASGTAAVNYSLANNNNLNTTGNIILTGNYNNQWQLNFSWSQTGEPVATLQALNPTYSGLRVAGYGAGGKMVLPNQQPATDTAIYQVIFNKG